MRIRVIPLLCCTAACDAGGGEAPRLRGIAAGAGAWDGRQNGEFQAAWAVRAPSAGAQRVLGQRGTAMATAVGTSPPGGADAERFAHFYEIVVAFQAAAPGAGGDVPVATYLAAMNRFLRIFDALASIGDLVKKDIESNIQKLGKAASKHGAETLAAVLKSEMADASYARLIRAEKGAGCDSGTVAMLWMKRTMQFVHGLMGNLLADPAASLADASRKSYAGSLSLCHPWVTRGVFDTGLRFAPARKAFYSSLGGGNDPTKVESAIRDFVAAMDPPLEHLTALYRANSLEKYVK
jgi:hypothetical protein